ncbi:MAG: hypothetical protein ABGY72_17855 [bacterium]
MFQKLIKKTNLDVEERTLSVRYDETRTLHGDARFSAEVVFQPEDHIILDADSVNRLETQVASLLHASVYSRTLIGVGSAV